jgi:crotonobetaine/carnitine-CoA ligase
LFTCDDNGFYAIVGRIKDVIRRSGENISATEVEHILCSMPDIVEAAAIPVPDALRGEEMKVCVVLQPGSDLPPDRVRAFCQDRLATFKLPRYLEYLPELPKTPSGKIAKPALIARDSAQLAAVFDFQSGVWG